MNRSVIALAVLFAACDRSAASQRPPPANAPPVSSAAGTSAADASAPDAVAADLVDVASVDPTIDLDLRYATPDNFTGTAVYPVARCLLRPEVAARLARVQRAVVARGYRLRLWDCYRPFSVQLAFWKLVPDERYVARPTVDAAGAPATGSRHNRGAAIDITLIDTAGRTVPMPTAHDDFSDRASRARAATAGTAWSILDAAMSAEGFTGMPSEWWHYDAPGWEAYPLLDLPLDRLHSPATPPDQK